MIITEAAAAAFSMYSRIPLGKAKVSDRGMRFALCAFPLVGAAIGAAEILWALICRFLDFDTILYAAAAAAIPVFVNGGIHLDGYLDTQDALNSFGDTKKKLEILKDPNSGAFAVIGGIVYFMLTFALFTEIERPGQLAVVCCWFVMSRALSALAAVYFKSARPGGMLGSVAGAAQKRAAAVSAKIYTAAGFVLSVAVSPVCGLCAAAAAALVFCGYRIRAYREFGGITGDLAGWFLQRCELAVLAAVVVSWRILCIL